jgi:hypothetical protein
MSREAEATTLPRKLSLQLKPAIGMYRAHQMYLSWPYHPADPGAIWRRSRRRGSATPNRWRKHPSLGR